MPLSLMDEEVVVAAVAAVAAVPLVGPVVPWRLTCFGSLP